jgi:hypothetical protein
MFLPVLTVVQTRVVFLVCGAVLMAAHAVEATPCRDPRATAALLKDHVVPNWRAITAQVLSAHWPGLQPPAHVGASPVALSAITKDESDHVVCSDYFSLSRNGGIQIMTLSFSGDRFEVLAATEAFASAVGRPITQAEREGLEREKWLVVHGREAGDTESSDAMLHADFQLVQSEGAWRLTFNSFWVTR